MVYLDNYLIKVNFQKFSEIFSKLKANYGDRFYIEIQRHGDLNEKEFEKFNLISSKKLDIPLIATNEVFYIDKDMHEAHDALICIKNKLMLTKKIELDLVISIILKLIQKWLIYLLIYLRH